jgi:hypothetical protein
MADWRKLAKALTLADGTIDDREVSILRDELFADGEIDESELEFLGELRNEAEGASPAFMGLYAQAVKAHVLADGDISDAETAWLRKAIFADGRVDADEKRLLQELKGQARSTAPSFQQLCREVLGG